MAEIAVRLATAAGEQLVGELSLLAGVRGEIQYIIDELETLRLFLKEAEEKQADNEVARVWVKQVRQLAYDVEDCLEDFSLHLHRGNRPNPLARLGHSLCSLTARHRIATQIQDIKRWVEEASSRRMRYGIITNAPSKTEEYAYTNGREYDPRLSALFIEDSQLVGIDGPREKLVGWLLDEADQLSLIAVVGEGGLGKTTIVKKAYDDPKVTGGHFECRAWITFSQTYNVQGILRDIIKQVNPTKDQSSMTGTQLINELRGHLKEKRYIIAFDDVWKIDAWNSLEMALPKNELGSRIILTTRNMELGKSACATPNIHGRIFPHTKLTPEDSKELFLRRVFNNPEQKACPKDLEDLALKIADKYCDGLPLAIISIAGVLASRPNKSRREWEKMMSQLGSELEHNPNLEVMNQILTLSYNDLPYYVRHCFLYLSKFPEDYVIERKRIGRLWIAEGFVSGRHDMTAEEVAESYFNELANRFLILPSKFSANGKVKWFTVHDILLELIVSKSREERFLSLITGNKDSGMVTEDVIRRLSVQDTNQHVEQNLSLSHVRSLTIHEGVMPKLISPQFGMLRVLDLEWCYNVENRHLKIIAKLFHLKYLSLRGSERVNKLPESLKRLRRLETLDIRDTGIWELPKWIIKLQQLRFLNDSGGLIVPRGIGRLSALQVLRSVDAKRSGKGVIKELRNLTQLQKLEVVEMSEDLMKDFCDSLAAMSSSLRSLNVHGRLHGLNDLSATPLLLESLDLYGELEQLPTWVLSLSNLVKLRLGDSCLEEDAIQSLGTLPNLSLLTLHDRAFNGESWCFGAQGFPRLKELRLGRLPGNVKSVSFQGGAMCQLELVTINWGMFDRMRISGITNLPSLKELRADMKNAEDREGVKAQVMQHPNRPTLMFE